MRPVDFFHTESAIRPDISLLHILDSHRLTFSDILPQQCISFRHKQNQSLTGLSCIASKHFLEKGNTVGIFSGGF